MHYSVCCCMRYSIARILYALFLQSTEVSNLYALRCPPVSTGGGGSSSQEKRQEITDIDVSSTQCLPTAPQPCEPLQKPQDFERSQAIKTKRTRTTCHVRHPHFDLIYPTICFVRPSITRSNTPWFLTYGLFSPYPPLI